MADGFTWRGKETQLTLGGVDFSGKVRVTFTPEKDTRRSYSREGSVQFAELDSDGGILEVEFQRTAAEDIGKWNNLSRQTIPGDPVDGMAKNFKHNVGFALEKVKLSPINYQDDEGGDTLVARAQVGHAKNLP